MSSLSKPRRSNWILVFDSIHHVLAAERALLSQDIGCDLVPTPREIHTDCGMVIEFRPSDIESVSNLVAGLASKPRRIYRPSLEDYEEVTIGPGHRMSQE